MTGGAGCATAVSKGGRRTRRGRASQARLLHTCAEGQHPEGGHGQHQPGPVHCRPMRLRDRKPCSIPTPVPWASSSTSSGDSSVSRIQGVSWPGIRIRSGCSAACTGGRPGRPAESRLRLEDHVGFVAHVGMPALLPDGLPQAGSCRPRSRRTRTARVAGSAGPRRLTQCTYSRATRCRKDCGRWREVTLDGRDEARERHRGARRAGTVGVRGVQRQGLKSTTRDSHNTVVGTPRGLCVRNQCQRD